MVVSAYRCVLRATSSRQVSNDCSVNTWREIWRRGGVREEGEDTGNKQEGRNTTRGDASFRGSVVTENHFNNIA